VLVRVPGSGFGNRVVPSGTGTTHLLDRLTLADIDRNRHRPLPPAHTKVR